MKAVHNTVQGPKLLKLQSSDAITVVTMQQEQMKPYTNGVQKHALTYSKFKCKHVGSINDSVLVKVTRCHPQNSPKAVKTPLKKSLVCHKGRNHPQYPTDLLLRENRHSILNRSVIVGKTALNIELRSWILKLGLSDGSLYNRVEEGGGDGTSPSHSQSHVAAVSIPPLDGPPRGKKEGGQNTPQEKGH